MKVLLINSNRFEQPWPVTPFGLCCVAASCEEAGHTIKVLDLCFSKNCAKDISYAVKQFKPDAIGISIRNIDNGTALNTIFLLGTAKKEVIAPCKEVFKGPIIIGGPAVGINGAQMLRFFGLEYAVCGDGDAVMPTLLKRLEHKEPVEGLKGLIIQREGRIVQDSGPFFADDLNSFPFPRPQKYINIKAYSRFDSALQIQTKRGCALNCVYCTYNYIEGRHYRLRSPERIAHEIEELVRETGIKHIEFTDSAFNIPLEHAKNVLRAVIKKDLNLRLRTMGLNPGAVDEELVDLMKEAGFSDVDLGAESGCDITLKGLDKNYTVGDIIRAAKLLHSKKIAIAWYFLFGAPDETEETVRQTLNTISEVVLSGDLVNMGVGIRVYKGAPIAEKMKIGDPCCTDDDFLYPIAFKPKGVSLETIKVILKRASFSHSNFYFYDEDETTPLIVLKLGTIFFRLFSPNQPIWRVFIILRKIETLLGIRKFKKWLWEIGQKGLKRRLEESEAINSLEEVLAYDREVVTYYDWMCRPQIKDTLRVMRKINKQPSDKISILDIGCGTGRISIGIAKKTDKATVHAVDISENMLKIALKNAREERLDKRIVFLKADGKKLDFKDNFFDIIMCSNMLHHQKDPVYLLNEMRRVVKKDGYIIIRDVVRPSSEVILNLFVGIFGLSYDKAMKKGYRESLYSAFTASELKKILNSCGMKEIKSSKSFPHFMTFIAINNK